MAGIERKDQLNLTVIKPELFYSLQPNGTAIHLLPGHLRARALVNKQLKYDTVSQIMSNYSDGVKLSINSIIYLDFTFNFIAQTSLSYILGTFNTL